MKKLTKRQLKMQMAIEFLHQIITMDKYSEETKKQAAELLSKFAEIDATYGQGKCIGTDDVDEWNF